MVKLKCSGWWEQQGYGRQPMDELELAFDRGHVTGAGTDVIGDFVFTGSIDETGIQLIKQYIGRHRIHYEGNYDGEGVYYGRWDYEGLVGGNWLIRVGIERSLTADAETEIAEI